MEPRRSPDRRRRLPARWSSASHRRGMSQNTYIDNVLEEWRATLAKVEREAAQHRCPEIQMLAGAAALAVDELIEVMLRKETDVSSDMR
jgi:hypothetical protein